MLCGAAAITERLFSLKISAIPWNFSFLFLHVSENFMGAKAHYVAFIVDTRLR